MKKSLPFILFMFFIQVAYSQNFEGEIVYSNKYTSKNQQVSDDQWNKMLGTTQHYCIKNGDYKSSTDGTMFQWQIYRNKDNKIYTKMSNSPVALWSDASVNIDEILKTNINKNALAVLGYMCDELILTCKSGTQKYYFNHEIAADVKLYEKHKIGNWFDYLSRTNALPLKSIVETDQFILESDALEITPLKIDVRIFEFPAGTKIEKSPY